jgi:hypothetical protein
VIVIEPAPPPSKQVSDDELAQRARTLVAEGMTTRAAADALAQEGGVSRRRAYDVVIAQRRGR